MEDQEIPEFKLVIIGDGGVGKTTLLNSLLTGEFEEEYISTVGYEIRPIKFFTNHGQFLLNVWDTTGQEKYGELRESYYHKC